MTIGINWSTRNDPRQRDRDEAGCPECGADIEDGHRVSFGQMIQVVKCTRCDWNEDWTNIKRKR